MGRATLFSALLLLLFVRAPAIDISAAGGWSETVDQSDLVSGAGSSLIDTYESTVSGTSIDVSNCSDDADNWRVEVRRIDDGDWYGDFVLYVKRTSSGDGGGSVSGGLSYVEITATDTELFSGAGNRTSIDLQYKLTGMSIEIAPDNYGQIVVFTVVDVP
jgi:hypothetical protein